MEKGLEILFNTYWQDGVWRKDSWKVETLFDRVSHKDFEFAKRQGYMFDIEPSAPHDKALEAAKNIASKIIPQDVAKAFLYSLSTRKLEFRSALSSYYYIKSIPKHEHLKISMVTDNCGVCYWEGSTRNDLNAWNFERYKWGGVRHGHVEYAKFDLELFLKLPKVTHTKEDVKILTAILEVAKKLPPEAKVGAYIKQLCSEKIFKFNKDEITVLLGILGICDIFNSEHAKGYLHSFTNADGSRDPIESKNDMMFPLNRWRAGDGINKIALKEVFECCFDF